jgi:hypothetical protein
MQAKLSVSKYKQSRAIILRDDEDVRRQTANKFMAEAEFLSGFGPGAVLTCLAKIPLLINIKKS